jgi:hypothetical protein
VLIAGVKFIARPPTHTWRMVEFAQELEPEGETANAGYPAQSRNQIVVAE